MSDHIEHFAAEAERRRADLERQFRLEWWLNAVKIFVYVGGVVWFIAHAGDLLEAVGLI